MSEPSPDRLDRLEARLAALEALVQGVVADRPPAPKPSAGEPDAARRPVAALWRSEAAEAWLGQRGLLAVGVLAMILAAGYLLKLSFERGWISPLARCLIGGVGGVAMAMLGWRLFARFRTYGAALIGCGAGIAYLAVWAATSRYGFLPPPAGIAGLALISVVVAALAYAVNVEALAATATAGLLMAPVILGQNRAHAAALLVYLALAAVGLGVAAGLRRWRFTSFLLTAGAAGLALPVEPFSPPRLFAAFAALTGTGGLLLGLRHRWWETRFLSFAGAWSLLSAVAPRPGVGLAVFIAAVAMTAPVWWHALTTTDADLNPPQRDVNGWLTGERLYFLVTPLLLGWALRGVAPDWFDARDGAVPISIALPYLAVALLSRRGAFALVGTVAMCVGIQQRWTAHGAVARSLAGALGWLVLGTWRRWPAAYWCAAVAYGAALMALLASAGYRGGEPAFTGAWALALWGSVAIGASGAYLAARAGASGDLPLRPLAVLFAAIGAAVLFVGVTGELRRFFEQQVASTDGAQLASGLSISAWWIGYAAALVLLGFRRGVPVLRWLGLAAAGATVAKVLLYDLASLAALYRVASVFILGIVSLALAWVYHRQAQARREIK